MISLIPKLDAKGIIQSICSKNDATKARSTLEKLGVWPYFVFPSIDFSAKGQNVRQQIEAMQLRSANVLFIDDNISNREEVKFYCDGIHTADPGSPDFCEQIEALLALPDSGSRLQQYKILEQKAEAKSTFNDNVEFLQSCNIQVCILRNPADLTFKDRIIELANRSNQLNFTHSRFQHPEDFSQQFEGPDSLHLNHGVIFVHDRFGTYGLVGFYAFDERKSRRTLIHYFFSCRIMNMGVEQAVLHHLQQRYRVDVTTALAHLVSDEETSAHNLVKVQEGLDAVIQHHIDTEMHVDTNFVSSVIAGCSSGVIAHYLPEALKPVRFDNLRLSSGVFDPIPAQIIIYSVYSDYLTKGWSRFKFFSYRKFAQHLERFITSHQGSEFFLLLASEKYPEAKANNLKTRLKQMESAWLHGRSAQRNRRCNQVVRELAAKYPNVQVIEMSALVQSPEEQIDQRHFERVVMSRLGILLRDLTKKQRQYPAMNACLSR